MKETDTNEILCEKIRRGVYGAKEQLLRQNLGMIYEIIRRERKHYRYLSLETEDLVAAGQMGLLSAAASFDPTCGTQFITYAWIKVRHEIQREMINSGRMIRIPVHIQERLQKLSVCRGLDSRQSTEVITKQVNQSVCAYGGKPLTQAQVEQCLRLAEPAAMVQSLNRPLKQDGVTQWQEMIPDRNTSEFAEKIHQRIFLEQGMKTLTEKERTVLYLHYGLMGNPEKTLSQIGEVLHVSKERVRQIEGLALKKMRQFHAGFRQIL